MRYGFYAACLLAYFAVPDRAIAGHRGCAGGKGAGCVGKQASCYGGSGCHGDRGLFRGRLFARRHVVHSQQPPLAPKAPAVPKAAQPMPNQSVCAGVNCVQATDDALQQVNQARAQRGLRPYIFDGPLARAARACAEFRASRRIEGHTPNDFQFLPSDATATAAGSGALEPSWGFQTCAMFDGYTYAGAASVVGPDGKVYHQLFVR